MCEAGSTTVRTVVVELASPLLYTVRVLDKVASMVIVMVVSGSVRLVSDSVVNASERVVTTGCQRVVVTGPEIVVFCCKSRLNTVRKVVSPKMPISEEADETAARAPITRNDFILEAVQCQQIHHRRSRQGGGMMGDERAVPTRDCNGQR
jgi:hypothetical protein